MCSGMALIAQQSGSVGISFTKPDCSPMCFDATNIDLGQIRKGEKLPLQFNFTNTSSEEIKISFIDACECSDVTYPKKAILPGGRGTLDVIFDSSKKDTAEVINIYLELTNINPKTKLPYFRELHYTFEFE
jgi:hypothetical protein